MNAKTKSFVMPAGMDLEDQLAYCIGSLVASWANCESLFYGFIACIVGKAETGIAPTIWLSIKSTKARVDLTLQLLNAANVPQPLKDEISKCAELFDGITRTRNFYCHSYYRVDPSTMNLAVIESFSFDPRARTYRPDNKTLNKATINELVETVRRTYALNNSLWKPLLELREILQAQHVELPEPFPEFLRPK
ncbi:hypothetical protein ELH77_04100 [Rhizobium ruizarguesonis]|uniref:hypothetical protein n=1 Tax=Rhizobium ruizarguesonis TaxID=2081791 RepID=UPI00102FD4F0|nr:hypothetical protein [Rhizobium ruizarguesonis]TAT98756.1 hypothetical protein ELI53_04095 [Rhizobium ruizarguesonis]TAZ18027.1 hypothetical protein ELH77_04100 [Rhizobium ruizarguesonis]